MGAFGVGPEEAGVALVGSGGFGDRFGADGTGIGRFGFRFRFRVGRGREGRRG